MFDVFNFGIIHFSQVTIRQQDKPIINYFNDNKWLSLIPTSFGDNYPAD